MGKKFSYIFFFSIAGSIYCQNFDYLPAAVGNHQIIEYAEFTLSYNEEHEQADWVAYKLTKEEAETSRNRCNCFKTDQLVLTESATEGDYKNTGFDKGHLSPAADNNITAEANEESFLMSNMSPQVPNFNRIGGVWALLEEWVRTRAIAYNNIYVATGPVFINNLGKIGNNEVTIPGYYYKVILRFNGSTAKTIAFLLPQVGNAGNIEDYVVTVNTIETLTGLDFFPKLDDSIENRVESQWEPGQWGL